MVKSSRVIAMRKTKDLQAMPVEDTSKTEKKRGRPRKSEVTTPDKPKPKIGRPYVHNLSEAEIIALAEEWATNEEIGSLLGCSVDTLTRRYADAIKKGRMKAQMSLRRHLWTLAKQGNAACAIFMSKNYLGMRDNPEPVAGNDEVSDFRKRLEAQEKAEGTNPQPPTCEPKA